VCFIDERSGFGMIDFDRVIATCKIGSHKVCWPVYEAPIQDSIFICFNVLASLGTVIFAAHGDSRIGKGINTGTLSYYGKDSICSAGLVGERC
jgi:hypothetical protein